MSTFIKFMKTDKDAARAWLEANEVHERELYDRVLNDPKYAKGFD